MVSLCKIKNGAPKSTPEIERGSGGGEERRPRGPNEREAGGADGRASSATRILLGGHRGGAPGRSATVRL